MTWRAFIIGLLAVAGLCLLDPYTSFIRGYGWFTGSAFPSGPVVIVVLLTVGLNVLIKLVRRAWALAQGELMLIWCMLIVASIFPCEGIGAFWYTLMASGPYMARRPDIHWEEGGALTYAPDGLLISKNPRSEVALRYFEPTGQRTRVPWRRWAAPLLRWTVFFVLLFLANFLLCGMLRRQWVEVERLMFPLARVPLEFTQGSGEDALLPALFSNRAFVAGLAATAAFRLVRVLPLLLGADSALALSVPFRDVFQGTVLEHAGFANLNLNLSAMGFAFLVPVDVSLSVWFFQLFSRAELLSGHYFAADFGGRGGGVMMRWQQAGAYMTFTAGMLFMARRHLWGVLRRALAIGGPDDCDEPVSYRLGFWGFIGCIGGLVGWYCHFGMRLFTALAVLALLFCWFLVYARMVAQSGLYVGRTIWSIQELIHGISGGTAFGPHGAVIAALQSGMLVTGTSTALAPMAMNAFRISDVFKKARRLLLPAMFVALLVAMACTTYTVLTQAYSYGAVNFHHVWTVRWMPEGRFQSAHRIITQPGQAVQTHFGGLVFGMATMAFVMLMRARFYWWPVHSIGLLACSTWNMNRIWFPFFLGWLIKVGVMKMAGGSMLRRTRDFFIALIVVEAFASGLSTVLRTLTAGRIPSF